jgi:hypothetical protein
MIAADLRYPITPRHPPLRVMVNVHWRGRQFVAQRDTHPKTRKPCWLTTKRGSGESWYLPPRGDERREKHAWGPNPDYWWPLKPENWQASLPPPLTAVIAPIPRAINIRARRRRHMPRLVNASEPREIKTPWWWDGATISYEPAGSVSREMAEGRAMRALAVHGAQMQLLPSRYERPFLDQFLTVEEALREAMKEAEREASAAVQAERTLRPKLVLGPNDHNDWLIAMAWFAALTPVRGVTRPVPYGLAGRERAKRFAKDAIHTDPARAWALSIDQKILIWRAQERWLSFRTIANLFGSPVGTVHLWYRQAIDEIYAAANGKLAVVDHIGALQERNRAHKRREHA